MASALQDVVRRYEEFIISNPSNASTAETILKAISYLSPVSGQYASVISELLLSTSNLLSLLNDAILRKAANIHLDVPISARRLQTWLSIIEHVEVFVEIASFTVGGDVHRWLVLVLIQIVKAALRFLLLLRHRAGIYHSPPIPVLKRSKQLKERIDKQIEIAACTSDDQPTVYSEAYQLGGVASGAQASTGTFKLSTGRVVRKLEATPPMTTRTWNIPDPKTTGGTSQPFIALPPTVVGHQQICGESLHILRPLAHSSMFTFGQASWKPFILACGMDVSSFYLMGDKKDYNLSERNELRRRMLMLLLYVLRSPFYDEYTKRRLLLTLKSLSDTIPLIHIIMNPILEYLPWWQKVYSYVWAQ